MLGKGLLSNTRLAQACNRVPAKLVGVSLLRGRSFQRCSQPRFEGPSTNSGDAVSLAQPLHPEALSQLEPQALLEPSPVEPSTPQLELALPACVPESRDAVHTDSTGVSEASTAIQAEPQLQPAVDGEQGAPGTADAGDALVEAASEQQGQRDATQTSVGGQASTLGREHQHRQQDRVNARSNGAPQPQQELHPVYTRAMTSPFRPPHVSRSFKPRPPFLERFPVPEGRTFNVNSFVGDGDPHGGKFYVPSTKYEYFLADYHKAYMKGYSLFLTENYHKSFFRYFLELDFPWDMDIAVVMRATQRLLPLVHDVVRSFYQLESCSTSATDGSPSGNLRLLTSIRTPYKVHLNFPTVITTELLAFMCRDKVLDACKEQLSEEFGAEFDWERIIDFPHGSFRLPGSKKTYHLTRDPEWVQEKYYYPARLQPDGRWKPAAMTMDFLRKASIFPTRPQVEAFERSQLYLDVVFCDFIAYSEKIKERQRQREERRSGTALLPLDHVSVGKLVKLKLEVRGPEEGEEGDEGYVTATISYVRRNLRKVEWPNVVVIERNGLPLPRAAGHDDGSRAQKPRHARNPDRAWNSDLGTGGQEGAQQAVAEEAQQLVPEAVPEAIPEAGDDREERPQLQALQQVQGQAQGQCETGPPPLQQHDQEVQQEQQQHSPVLVTAAPTAAAAMSTATATVQDAAAAAGMMPAAAAMATMDGAQPPMADGQQGWHLHGEEPQQQQQQQQQEGVQGNGELEHGQGEQQQEPSQPQMTQQQQQVQQQTIEPQQQGQLLEEVQGQGQGQGVQGQSEQLQAVGQAQAQGQGL